MKRIVVMVGAGLTLLLICAAFGMLLWIGHDVKANIQIAKSQYPGKAEDALIAYLLDTTHSFKDRNSVAVWTLGQIHSQKALPVLINFYKNDPKGLTCKHRHALCQYEIYKAIRAIKGPGWALFSVLNN